MARYCLSVNPAKWRSGNHDSSAVLTKEGEIVFAVEEERLTREKHALDTFPENAVEQCMEYADIGISDIEKVYVPWKPRQLARRAPSLLKNAVKSRDVVEAVWWMERAGRSAVLPYLDQFGSMEKRFRSVWGEAPEIEPINHHRSHAASAFFPSGFEEALVLTIDARGETDSTVAWRGKGQDLERLETYSFPNSLGYFYAASAQFLGFGKLDGEGKMMALAPYGEQNPEIENRLREIVDTEPPYDVSVFGAPSQEPVGEAVRTLEEIFDRRRKEGDGYGKWEKDFAYTVQKLLEEIVVSLARRLTGRTGLNNIALAGGVALNCKMNMVLREQEFVENLFVQPVANDAGAPLGPAYMEEGARNFNIFSGPEYSGKIEELLEKYKIDYKRLENPAEEAAESIESGEIVGWYQGRMEFGPRALGSRSILGDPSDIDAKRRINRKVKNRENWRPFAPSMLQEATGEYLGKDVKAPYMIQAYKVEEDKEEEIPAVIHPADGTMRPQTVDRSSRPCFYRLISRFEDLTGIPMVLNTSFNRSGEPIVNSPQEAIQDFYVTGMDRLFLGDYMLEK